MAYIILLLALSDFVGALNQSEIGENTETNCNSIGSANWASADLLYIGCYERDCFQDKISFTIISINECTGSCRNESYQYAALEFGSTCYCGNFTCADKQSEKQRCNSFCGVQCALENGQFLPCGGIGFIQVYMDFALAQPKLSTSTDYEISHISKDRQDVKPTQVPTQIMVTNTLGQGDTKTTTIGGITLGVVVILLCVAPVIIYLQYTRRFRALMMQNQIQLHAVQVAGSKADQGVAAYQSLHAPPLLPDKIKMATSSGCKHSDPPSRTTSVDRTSIEDGYEKPVSSMDVNDTVVENDDGDDEGGDDNDRGDIGGNDDDGGRGDVDNDGDDDTHNYTYIIRSHSPREHDLDYDGYLCPS